jgi:hypothetical protein
LLPSNPTSEDEWKFGTTYAYVIFEEANVQVRRTQAGDWIKGGHVVVKIGRTRALKDRLTEQISVSLCLCVHIIYINHIGLFIR